MGYQQMGWRTLEKLKKDKKIVIKIKYYDPIKGKGEYLTSDMEAIPFRYKLFAGRMIKNGKLAKIINGKIVASAMADMFIWFFKRFVIYSLKKMFFKKIK